MSTIPLLWLTSCAQVQELQTNIAIPTSTTAEIRQTTPIEPAPPVASPTNRQEQELKLPDEKIVPVAGVVETVKPEAMLTTSWSLADIQQMAAENHPTIQQAIFTLNKTYGMHTQVGLKPNPTISYVGDEMGDEGTAGRQGAFISQTIVTGDKLYWNQQVVEGEMVAVRWQLETTRQRVKNDVQLQYYEVLGLQQKLKLAKELEEIALAGVKTAKALFAAQQAARPDILQAEIQLNEVRILRKNAEYDHSTAWSVLASLSSLPDWERGALAGTLDDFKAQQRHWDISYQQLLASSPELQAAYAIAHRAQLQIGRQRAQVTPNLITQLSVTHDNTTGDDLTSVQLGIPLPLFNRNQGNINLASSDFRRATWNAQRLELALRVRLLDAFRNYQKAEYQVERYRQDILPNAKENLRLTEIAYKEQELGFLRVLTARRSYFESNMQSVDALIKLLKADALIEGLLLTGSLETVPDNYNGALRGVGLRGQALNGQ